MENNETNSTEPVSGDTAPQPAAAPTSVNIGGLTLKKRAPGSPAPASSSGPGTFTRGPGAGAPRPAGGGPPGAFGRPTGPNPNAVKRMERFSRVMPTRDPGVRMNENIRVPEIRVIDDEGQVGVMSPREALEIARERGLDLIEIVPNAQPPVCKIIDFGKWKYEQQKREKVSKKASHQQLLKEVRFHPSTDTHDFEFKLRHARSFIEEGNKVKATVQFKGREVAYKQFGEELLTNFKARLEDIAKIDQDVSMIGRSMSVVLSPSGKKKAEAKRASDAAEAEKPPRAPRKPKVVEAEVSVDGVSASASVEVLTGDTSEQPTQAPQPKPKRKTAAVSDSSSDAPSTESSASKPKLRAKPKVSAASTEPTLEASGENHTDPSPEETAVNS